MTKRTRTILFFGLALLFFFTAPTVVLYSQGYRIDWKGKRITQIGALYFKVIPPRANVYIDGKPKEKTALVFGTMLVENLLPKQYKARIAKEGYHPWEKVLEVKPKQVTEAKNVILIPLDIKTRVLVENVEQFWASPNGKETILQKNTPQRTWKLTLWDFEKNLEYEFFKPESRKESLWNLEWSPNADKVLVQINTGEEIRSLIQDIDRELLSPIGVPAPAKLQKGIELNFLGQGVSGISFLPAIEERILFMKSLGTTSVLMEADYAAMRILSRLGSNGVVFAAEGSDVLWLDAKGILWRKNIVEDSDAEFLNTEPFPVQSETKYEILLLNGHIFLRENEEIFQLNSETKNFKKVFGRAAHFSLSPDGKKIAFSNGTEVWIYYLENQENQPMRKKGDNIFLTRFSQKVENLSWLNPHYLLFSVGDTMKSAEIDNRGSLNIVDIAVLPNPILFWEEQEKILYILSDEKFYATEKIIR